MTVWKNIHCCRAIGCGLFVSLIVASSVGLSLFLDTQYQTALEQYKESVLYGTMTIRRKSDPFKNERQFGSLKYQLSSANSNLLFYKYKFIGFYNPVVTVNGWFPTKVGNDTILTFRNDTRHCAGVPIIDKELPFCLKCKNCDSPEIRKQWEDGCHHLRGQSENKFNECINSRRDGCISDSFVGETFPITTVKQDICNNIWVQNEVTELPVYEFSSFTYSVHAGVITGTVFVGLYILLQLFATLGHKCCFSRVDSFTDIDNAKYGMSPCEMCGYDAVTDEPWYWGGYFLCCYGIRRYRYWLNSQEQWSLCSRKLKTEPRPSAKPELESSSATASATAETNPRDVAVNVNEPEFVYPSRLREASNEIKLRFREFVSSSLSGKRYGIRCGIQLRMIPTEKEEAVCYYTKQRINGMYTHCSSCGTNYDTIESFVRFKGITRFYPTFNCPACHKTVADSSYSLIDSTFIHLE